MTRRKTSPWSFSRLWHATLCGTVCLWLLLAGAPTLTSASRLGSFREVGTNFVQVGMEAEGLDSHRESHATDRDAQLHERLARRSLTANLKGGKTQQRLDVQMEAHDAASVVLQSQATPKTCDGCFKFYNEGNSLVHHWRYDIDAAMKHVMEQLFLPAENEEAMKTSYVYGYLLLEKAAGTEFSSSIKLDPASLVAQASTFMESEATQVILYGKEMKKTKKSMILSGIQIIANGVAKHFLKKIVAGNLNVESVYKEVQKAQTKFSERSSKANMVMGYFKKEYSKHLQFNKFSYGFKNTLLCYSKIFDKLEERLKTHKHNLEKAGSPVSYMLNGVAEKYLHGDQALIDFMNNLVKESMLAAQEAINALFGVVKCLRSKEMSGSDEYENRKTCYEKTSGRLMDPPHGLFYSLYIHLGMYGYILQHMLHEEIRFPYGEETFPITSYMYTLMLNDLRSKSALHTTIIGGDVPSFTAEVPRPEALAAQGLTERSWRDKVVNDAIFLLAYYRQMFLKFATTINDAPNWMKEKKGCKKLDFSSCTDNGDRPPQYLEDADPRKVFQGCEKEATALGSNNAMLLFGAAELETLR